MTCAGCASKITSALQRDRRVSSAVIDFATRSGVIEGEISEQEIERIVNSVGYRISSFGQLQAETKKSADQLSAEVRRLIPATFLAAPVVLVAMGPWNVPYGAWIQLSLTTVFMLGPASGFFIRAIKQIRHGFVTMDTLVALGIGSAWSASLVMMASGHSEHLYFESGVMIGFFILLGKTLEDQARRKSIGEVDRLVRLRPRNVWRVGPSGLPEEVPVANVSVGEQIYLRPGDMLALDGTVVQEAASFDESIITGESVPVVRSMGDAVPSGAINAGATGVTMKVTGIGKNTTVEKIIQLIEDARLSRPPIQKLADQISNIFVPVVIALAVLTFLYWWLLGGLDVTEGLMIGLSVLVVACPCALGLATPVAWVAGLGRAARAGVLVRSYEALETLRRANAVIFDKTGTLTEGRPTVINVIGSDELAPEFSYAALLSTLSHSSHPLSRAMAHHIRELPLILDPPLSKLIEERPGQGVICEIKLNPKHVIKYGRPEFVVQEIPQQWLKSLSSGNPTVAVSLDEKPLFIFELKDAMRPDAQQSLARIRARGFEIYVASGDKDSVVDGLRLLLPEVTSFKGRMTPESKKDLVQSLQKTGKVVAFVGDGINDAPALAAADIGISMGTGTDVAAHSAGLVLQRPGLLPLLDAIDLSSRITKIIKENFFWAFFYNVAAIPIAMMGYITPMWAAAAMALSSVSVVTNALRLRR